MRRHVFYFLTGFALFNLIPQCAQVGFITGGSKDTIPPSLIETLPSTGTTNYRNKIIRLTFDEWVNADKVKSSLLIAPSYPLKYSVLTKKNVVSIKIESDLLDSTTYTFNFTTGITDITEKNPGENVTVSFSTGDKIDTLSVSGTIHELYTNLPVKSNVVALYPISDTLDIQKHKPKYVVNSNELGGFLFTYIKPDSYRLITFKDENKNQLIDPTSESYGFYSDTLFLTSPIDSLPIKTYKLDFSNLKLLSAKSFGRYFDIKYSKPITSYTFNSLNNDTLPFIPSYLHDSDKTIRIIPFELFQDSLSILISARDTLQQTKIDTININFTPSTRKKDENKISISPTKTSIYDTLKFSVESTKPIKEINNSALRIKILDSLYFSASSVIYNLNERKTKIDFTIPINWNQLSDSLLTYKFKQLPDSVDKTDSLNLPRRTEIKQISLELIEPFLKTYEDDTLQTSSIIVTRKNKKELGKLIVNINSSKPSYFPQLLTKDLKLIKTFTSVNNFEISDLSPGTYILKVLIDEDLNGKYDLGNILSNKKEEEIYHYKKELIIKSNWDLTVDDITF